MILFYFINFCLSLYCAFLHRWEYKRWIKFKLWGKKIFLRKNYIFTQWNCFLGSFILSNFRKSWAWKLLFLKFLMFRFFRRQWSQVFIFIYKLFKTFLMLRLLKPCRFIFIISKNGMKYKYWLSILFFQQFFIFYSFLISFLFYS